MDEKMLTNRGLAELLQVSTRQIRRMALAGKLPQPIYVGRFPRWRESSVRAWMESAERAAARKVVNA